MKTIALFLLGVLTTASTYVEPAALSAGGPRPIARCFCKISIHDLTNQHSATGVIQDLTGTVNKTYSGVFQQSDANQTNCNTRCTAAAAGLTGSQALAAAACAAGAANGTVVRAWSAVGTREYKSSQQIGVLVRTESVTTCTCPKGWLANTTNVDGGVTGDGRCKREACANFTVSPPPPNGTHVGTWGFTFGNSLVAYGSAANGGAASCVTTPGSCHF